MPELPEVETVCRKLNQYVNQKVESVSVTRPDLRYPIPKTMGRKLKGKKIRGISRRAKYLIWDFGDVYLLSHLGMTGNWRGTNGEAEKHDHIIIKTAKTSLVYSDPRRFGYIDICKKSELVGHRFFKKLGVEPLARQFSVTYLGKIAAKRSTPIKSLIMNQSVVVGVGNIYANEALFKAGIHPEQNCSSIAESDLAELIKHIKWVLRAAIKQGGSTISDFEDPEGNSGYFQMNFQVYGRQSEKCPKCTEKIQRVVIGQRSSFYCPRCQRLS